MFLFCAIAPFLLRHAVMPAARLEPGRIELTIPPREAASPNRAAANPLPVAIALSPGLAVPMLPPAPPAPVIVKIPKSGKPWLLYGQPFDRNDPRPRIALVIGGPEETIETAIEILPAGVTLALDPYARRLPEWIALARAHGHEIVLTLSQEGAEQGFGTAPATIISSLDAKENVERLAWALERTVGFVGVLDVAAQASAGTVPLAPIVRDHGLMLINAGGKTAAEAGAMPYASGDFLFDGSPDHETSEKRLGALEATARNRGAAVAIGIAAPGALRKFAAWTAGLDRKAIALAPVTALANPSGVSP